MNGDARTLRAYATNSAAYVDLVSGAENAGALTGFISALPQGARVLDLGCGPGHCAARMAAAGLNVDAVDATAEMVRIANAQPGVTASLSGFDDLTAAHTYHGIWASFSLLHAPKSALAGHLSAIHRALRAGGLLCIAMKLGRGEKRDALGRLYAYYSAAELDQHLIDAGFTVIGRETGVSTGLAGDTLPHITINARA